MRNVILLASFAINIFLIGLVAGGHLFSSGKPPPGPERVAGANQTMADPIDILPLRAIQTLPPEYRRGARQTIATHLPQSRALRNEIANLRQITVKLMKQPDLDEERLAAAVEALQTAQFEQQRLTGQTIQKILTDLPDAERIALLTRVDEFRRMHREKWLQQRRGKVQGEKKQNNRPDNSELGDDESLPQDGEGQPAAPENSD